MTSSLLRVPALVLAGSLLMQLAWILALPSFRGLDEFAHVYRAAAVGHGEWVAEPSEAVMGTGAVLTVPLNTVKAATPVCETMAYTTAADCIPQEDGLGQMTTIASGAGRYNPLYYATIGYPTRFLDGHASVYSMRVLTAIGSSILLALASLALTIWARSRWPLVGLLVAWTPVAVYSTAVVAPNGPEMAAGALVWSGVLGLAQRPLAARQVQALVFLATPGAIALATLRSLGPLWLVLIVACCILLGGGQIRENLRGQRKLISASVLIVALSTLASVLWILQMRSLKIGVEEETPGLTLTDALTTVPLWLFQSVAAFPSREEFAPAVVYQCCFTVGAVFVGVAILSAGSRQRRTMLAILALTIGLPAVMTILTYSTFGPAWQGRYALPFAVGFMLVAGAAMESRSLPKQLVVPSLLGAAVALALAHSIGVINVLAIESKESPLVGTGAWIPPAAWLVGALVVLGWLCWSFAVRASGQRELPRRTGERDLAKAAA